MHSCTLPLGYACVQVASAIQHARIKIAQLYCLGDQAVRERRMARSFSALCPMTKEGRMGPGRRLAIISQSPFGRSRAR